MAFKLTEDQEQFRDIVARFCRDKSPTTAVRELMATEAGYDAGVWQQLCAEVGAVGIHVPEAKGGVGFGPVELSIVMEEFGRSLLCSPYFASGVLATTAIAEAATAEQANELLPGIVSGDVIGALAVSEDARSFEPERLQTVAAEDGGSVTGSKHFVVDGLNANLLIVSARLNNEPRLFAVDAEAAGVTRSAQASMDPTRKLARVEFDNAPATLLGNSAVDITPIYNTALVALANEMVGGAQALLDAAVEYTKLRVQFGRTIGSFQAIKHRLADLLLQVELAKSTAYQAAQVLADEGAAVAKASEAASLAKAACADAYLEAAIQCIQLHGGIGFTWENDTHLWFKRAKSSEVFLGSPNQHRERMLQAMGV